MSAEGTGPMTLDHQLCLEVVEKVPAEASGDYVLLLVLLLPDCTGSPQVSPSPCVK